MGAKKSDDRPDRNGETREGYVPVGRRGWLKVGGGRRTTEVQPVTPNWSRALRDQPKAGGAPKGAVILGQDWYHHLKRLEAKKRAESEGAEQKDTKEQRKENE